MKTIRFIPGNVVSPNIITLPVGAPDIDGIVSGEIIRVEDTVVVAHGASVTDMAHGAGAVVPHTGLALENHTTHVHDITTQGAAGAPAVLIGWPAAPAWDEIEDAGAVATHTFTADNTTGIMDVTLSAHVVTQPDDHTPAEVIAGVADHGGANVALALINHAAAVATPVVGCTPVRDTARTFHLAAVDTELGDLLVLSYMEVGEVVCAA